MAMRATPNHPRVTRRVGREVLERVAQPLMAGIHTADPDSLSLEAIAAGLFFERA